MTTSPEVAQALAVLLPEDRPDVHNLADALRLGARVENSLWPVLDGDQRSRFAAAKLIDREKLPEPPECGGGVYDKRSPPWRIVATPLAAALSDHLSNPPPRNRRAEMIARLEANGIASAVMVYGPAILSIAALLVAVFK